MLQSKTISIQIERDFNAVYAFLAAPRNLPKWSVGMGPAFNFVGGTDWVFERSDGPMTVTFSEYNKYGILDHVLTPTGGKPQVVPMRVFRNGDGAEIVYTLFKPENMNEEQFASELEWLLVDFGALKSLLETE